jgi:hypothetical protein
VQSHLDWVLKMITQAAMDYIAVKEITIELPSVEFDMEVHKRFMPKDVKGTNIMFSNYLGTRIRFCRKKP